MSISHDGVRVSVDQSQLDFTAFSHHAGEGQYDTSCSRSWYDHYSEGKVCPNYPGLLNNADAPGGVFRDGFESGDTSTWSATRP